MCINLFETRENSHQCIVKFVSIIEQLETLHVFVHVALNCVRRLLFTQATDGFGYKYCTFVIILELSSRNQTCIVTHVRVKLTQRFSVCDN